MPYRLSPSSLKIYFDCPRCFYLGVKERIFRPRIFEASIANGMDKLIKEWFDSYRIKKQAPPEIEKEGLELFQNKDMIDEWRDNHKGIIWHAENENSFMGVIDDLLVNKKGFLTVLDYKTKGSPIYEDPLKDHPEFKFQLESYAFIFQKMKYEVADKGYLLYFIPAKMQKSGNVKFDRVLWPVDLDLERPEKVFREAIKVLETDAEPESGRNCAFCKREEKLLQRRDKTKK